MTIIVSIKVNEGVVIAADSATTVDIKGKSTAMQDGEKNIVHHWREKITYNSRDKIFELFPGFPVSVAAYGMDSANGHSLASVLKCMGKEFLTGRLKFRIFRDRYTIEEICQKMDAYFKSPSIGQEFLGERDTVTLSIAGYSSGEHEAEIWDFCIDRSGCTYNKSISDRAFACNWCGQTSLLKRIINGYDESLSKILRKYKIITGETVKGICDDTINEIQKEIREEVRGADIFHQGLPIRSAIEIAEFLVYTGIMYSKFSPGANEIGGEIDIAAITLEDGFVWIKKKPSLSNWRNQDA